MASQIPRVFLTRRLPEPAWKLLKSKSSSFQLTVRDSELPIPYKDLLEGVVGVDALLCLIPDKIDEGVIKTAGPNFKVGIRKVKLMFCVLD